MVDKEVHVYQTPPAAYKLLVESLGVSEDAAKEALRILLKNGWYVVPREPTNGMLMAYMKVTQMPTKHESIMNAVGKASRRWRAMCKAASKAAFSSKELGYTDE